MSGASVYVLASRVVYGGRKGRSAYRRLREKFRELRRANPAYRHGWGARIVVYGRTPVWELMRYPPQSLTLTL